MPLLYMGDELAQCNDVTYRADPAPAGDNRWMHRPFFDDDAAARRHAPATVEGRVFGWMKKALGATRAEQPALHAGGEGTVLDVDSPHVLAWRRRHPRSGHFVGMANFAEHAVTVDPRALDGLGRLDTVLSSDGPLLVHQGRLVVPALGFVWLAEP